MALTHHFSLAPAANDVAVYDFSTGAGQTDVTLERTGVSAGDAGWAKYSKTAALQGGSGSSPFYFIDVLDVAVPQSGASFVWDIGYWYGRALPSAGDYKGVWKLTANYNDAVGSPALNNCGLELRKINDVGTEKFELVERDTNGVFSAALDVTTSLGKSGAFISGVTRTVTIRIDEAAKIVYVYIDDALAITGTLVLTRKATPDNIGYFTADSGGPNQGNTDPKGFYVGASSIAVDGYWSSWGRFSSTVAADLNELTQFPEAHGHGPNADGNYAAWAGQPAPASYARWADLVANGLNDGGTTFNWDNQTFGKQSSKIESRTYANTVKGATMLLYTRESTGAKTIPWSALMRGAATDKEIALPSPADTSFRNFNAGYNTLAGGAAINTQEIGADRTAAGDATNVEVTAIWLEGFALGVTKKAPPDPPVAPVAHIIELDQAVQRASIW